MAISLQVIYPITKGSTFDYDYYATKHIPLVAEHLGSFVEDMLVTKGVAGGQGTPPAYYAIASMIFPDQSQFDAAMGIADPVLADVPNFTNITPQMLIGEVIE
ncbi:EthD family reductase [Roseibium algae]|uniref:EthD family reductase n=1 Tax=Roseibium algae TaxID=3123038 RepID=A0ABU8TI56_9HYPH